MSIQNELTALSTNLANAKSAVENKGGTVGDTGLAGLSTEIASIPAGGGGLPKLKYYPATVTVGSYSEVSGIVVTDAQKAMNLFLMYANRLEIVWDPDESVFKLGIQDGEMMGEHKVVLKGSADILNDYAGLNVSHASGIPTDVHNPWGEIYLNMTPDKTGTPIETEYLFGAGSIVRYTTSSGSTEYVLTPEGNLITTNLIKEIEVKDWNTKTGAVWRGVGKIMSLQHCTHIKLSSDLYLGGWAFGNFRYLEEVDVGDYEVSYPYYTINSSGEVVSVSGTVTGGNNFTFLDQGQAYTNGVVVKGAKAQQFIAKFPNSTKSGYLRKWILSN